MYPLQALLSVRLFREDAARSQVRQAEREVTEAREAVQRCEEELLRYQEWWPTEVDRRYDGIMNQAMKLEELDAFKGGLGLLADGELKRSDAVLEAQKEVESKEMALIKAHEAAAQARRDAAKIEAHREIWKEQEKKEAEHAEDLEMEEFKPTPPLNASEDM